MDSIIAKHIIRPSTPTPHTLRTHQLSYLDQNIPSQYIPLIFLYQNDESIEQEEIWRRLKQSLSEVLTIFYPIAGSIQHNAFVDCDDTGVEMVEARIHAHLTEFIQNPKHEELKRLVPADRLSHDDNVLLSVKVSFFDCGGVSVGVYLSHKIADGASFATFMNAWAATCRGGEASKFIHPTFDMATHFPPATNVSDLGFQHLTKEKAAYTKRFVFEAGKLDKLRKGLETSVTKVEAVSSFMWRSFIEASKCKSAPGETLIYAAFHAVNLRPRMLPPMPAHAFGNCATAAIALVSSEEDDAAKLGVLESKSRAAIRAIDNDYINEVLKDGEKYSKELDRIGNLYNNSRFCACSSWRFPLYDVDFGWGKPVWVCTTSSTNPSLIIMMDSPSKDGIEAWVNFPDHHFLQIFQANYDKLLLN